MEPVYRSIAGIDVHRKMLAVVMRQEHDGQVCYTKRKFAPTRTKMSIWRRGCSMSRRQKCDGDRRRSIGGPDVVRAGVALPAALDASVDRPGPRGRQAGFRTHERLADRWSSEI